MTVDTNFQLALDAVKKNRLDEATGLLSGLLAKEPQHLQARWLLVQVLEGQRSRDLALDQLRILLIHAKNDLPAIDRIASHLRQQGYALHHVLDAYEKYLQRHPDSANAAFNYAWYLARDGQFESAIKWYERSLALGISSPEEVHLNIANIQMDHLVARDSAKAHLESALALNPGYSSAWYNLGNLAEQAGNRDEACRNFEKCLHADPANESALARLADAHKFVQRDDPLLNRLITTATNSRNSDVHFALGKAYEQAGEFGLAWDCFSKGNTLDERLMPAYKPERVEARFRHIMSQTVRYSLDRDERQSNDPIFICGMFRSGSTLLEQVLAAHPRFVAGGESEFFPRLVARAFPDYPQGVDGVSLEKLAAWRDQHNARSEKFFGKSSRVTDKRPDNFLYVGLIKAVLPSARFVVMERDWRDVATSIYSVRLGPTQNYATNLRNIRHYIGQQTELVNYWESILGADLVRIRYEDVVHDAQKKITELLVWLGESWDAQCLSFHTLTNSVRTASVWQVREPLHENSVGRWKNYERQFADVFGNTPDD